MDTEELLQDIWGVRTDYFEGVELILQIVLGRTDIKVTSVRTQELMKNLQGRSAVLDVHAVDSTNPDDMNYETLAERARHFKQDKERVAAMCKIMEDMRNEAALDNARETAEKLIKKGKMTLEDIAECVPLLSLDDLKEIEKRIMQMA